MTVLRGIRMLPQLLWWSPVKFLFVVFLGVDLACLWDRVSLWRGDWTSSIDWAGGSILLLGPVIAGVAAWRGSASKAGLGEPADVGGMAWRASLTEAVVTASWAVLAHLATLAVALVTSARAGAAGTPDLLPILPQLGLIVGYAALGAVVGNIASNLLAAPLTAVTLLYVTTQMSSGSRGELWFRVGGATSSLAGYRYSPSVLAAQTGLGLAVGLLVLGIRRTTMGRFESRPVFLAAGLIPALALAGWLHSGPSQYQVSDSAPGLSCVGSAPEVCTLPADTSTGHVLQKVWSAERRSTLRAGYPSIPARFVQVVAGRPGAAGTRTFVLDAVLGAQGAVDPLLATFYFEVDRSCLTAAHAPPGGPVARLQVLGEYLLVDARLEPVSQLRDPILSRVLRAPRATRDAWVKGSLAAAQTCDFDNVPQLPGNG